MSLFTWMFNVVSFEQFQLTGMFVTTGLVLTLLTLKFFDFVKRVNTYKENDGQI